MAVERGSRFIPGLGAGHAGTGAHAFGRSGPGFTRIEFMFEPQTTEALDAMGRVLELLD